MNVIKKIAIEIRPRLQSCNVALLTDSDFADNYHLKVSIRPNFIIINYTEYETKAAGKLRKRSRRDSTSSCESYSDSEEETYEYSKFMNVATHCKLIPSSLSSLKIESEFISFRVLTEPSSGTFFKEVVSNGESDGGFVCENQIVNINKGDVVTLKCVNCSHQVSPSNGIEFQRVLELPSDNLDMSEWFCHGHNDKPDCDAAADLNPKMVDLFYGNCYFVVNAENLSQQFVKFNEKRNILYCNRCFFWVGIKRDASAYKFWNSCIKFNKSNQDESVHLFSYPRSRSSTALSDFLYIIRHGIKNSFVGCVSPVCKLLLECKLTAGEKQFMLVWVMDKCLDVLKSEGDELAPVVELNQFKLELVRTSKLLYRIIDDPDAVKNIINDSAVQNVEISKNMFFDGYRHLEAMAVFIPHSFKKSNDFFVTYLEL